MSRNGNRPGEGAADSVGINNTTEPKSSSATTQASTNYARATAGYDDHGRCLERRIHAAEGCGDLQDLLSRVLRGADVRGRA
jgi:hypothetical protein